MSNKFERQTLAWCTLVAAVFILLMLFVNVVMANETKVKHLKGLEPKLYEFIARNTDYNVEGLPPVKYVFKPGNVLQEMFYGKPVTSVKVEALYANSTIVLNDEYDPLLMSHIQLHELVHHAQLWNNAEFKCTAEAEREAYLLMDKYVEETGIGTKTDPIFLMFMRCREELRQFD